ncbi:WhiB family transcriptional regulator [Streptomyces sp. NPDC127105]|uniref:WhiB family transcriptional regulator n=1 Tax=Streptomyces sp. NPDC127105 TaxID=3345359 RepID=UPI003647C8F8
MAYEGHVGVRTRGDQTWQEGAACAKAVEVAWDLDLFFPTSAADDRRVALAKGICSSCQVRRTCLEKALECGDVHGIRGGLTEAERKVVRPRFELRCEPARVAAALSGRDVYLTRPEQQELVRLAAASGMPTLRVATALKVSEGHVKKLLRRERRKIADTHSGAQGETSASRVAVSV